MISIEVQSRWLSQLFQMYLTNDQAYLFSPLEVGLSSLQLSTQSLIKVIYRRALLRTFAAKLNSRLRPDVIQI
jgi:hypothetical protein